MRKSTLKTIVGLMTIAVIGVGLVGFASSGFSNWERDSWRDRFIGLMPTTSNNDRSIDEEDEFPEHLQRKTFDFSSLTEDDFVNEGSDYFYSVKNDNDEEMLIIHFQPEGNFSFPLVDYTTQGCEIMIDPLKLFELEEYSEADYTLQLFLNKEYVSNTTIAGTGDYSHMLSFAYYVNQQTYQGDYSTVDILLVEAPEPLGG